MTNLNKIKKENNYHSKKDYKSAILSRSTKNKAMIGFTSVAAGGGVFLGLLVPGLLPVVLAGAPILAMSTNIVVSAAAGSVVGGVHYAINRKEGKLRKYTKRVSKGFRYKFDAEIDDSHHNKKLNKSDKQLNKGKSVYDHYYKKLEALRAKNAKLQAIGASASALDRNNKKIKKLEEGLAKLDDSYLNARQLYQDDLARLMGSGVVLPTPAVTPAPSNPTTNPNPTVHNENEKVKTEKKSLKDKMKEKFNFVKPSKIAVENNEAVKKLKSMLNLETPTLEDNAKYFESKVLFDKYTPSRVTVDRDLEACRNLNMEEIANQGQKLIISDAFDDMDYNFLEYENFVNDTYNLPIKNGKSILKIEFENPALDITYELNDYQKSISKPVFVATEIVELMNSNQCGACKITSSMVDENGKNVDSALNFEIDIHDLKEAVFARNVIYTRMLNYMYSAQKSAFENDIKSKTSGLSVINKACDLAMPKVNKTKEDIIDDLKSIKEITKEEETFFNTQFLGMEPEAKVEKFEEVELIDSKSVEVVQG